MSKRNLKIAFNAPVVLGFFFLCLGAFLLNLITRGFTNRMFFSVYRSSLLSPFTYIRFIGHIFGHANWQHFLGNMTLFLVVGPLLEEKYGSKNILSVILVTALSTGIVQYLFFPHSAMLGASGVVFSFILLASFTGFKDGTIPLTFILVAVIYLGQQVYEGIFVANNVANLSHIIGGVIGAGIGYAVNRKTY